MKRRQLQHLPTGCHGNGIISVNWVLQRVPGPKQAHQSVSCHTDAEVEAGVSLGNFGPRGRELSVPIIPQLGTEKRRQKDH